MELFRYMLQAIAKSTNIYLPLSINFLLFHEKNNIFFFCEMIGFDCTQIHAAQFAPKYYSKTRINCKTGLKQNQILKTKKIELKFIVYIKK